MNIKVKLKKIDGTKVNGTIKILDESYIEKIMILQEQINRSLVNKEWYSPTSKEEFYMQLTKIGKIVGCVLDDNTLIAIGAYVECGYEEHNYGYDLGIEGKKLLKVGQIEATLVHEDYRGNKLQKKICIEIEKIAKSRKNKVIAVTVHPDNIYSLRTFEDLKYKTMLKKLKYEGLIRLVLMKKI